MTKELDSKRSNAFTLKISLEQKPDFKGEVAAFLFDVAGNLLEKAKIKEGKAYLTHSDEEVARSRLFIAPLTQQADGEAEKPSIKMMERLGAYEPVLRQNGKVLDSIVIPAGIIDLWPICFCWVRGQVVKDDNSLPVCGAKVHICEVDRLWRWFIKLPDRDVLKLRDDLLKKLEEPLLRRSTFPEPDPSPLGAMKNGLLQLNFLNPQPEPPPRTISNLSSLFKPSNLQLVSNAVALSAPEATLGLPVEVLSVLSTNSVQAIRDVLIVNVKLIIPYLCLLRPWWRYHCDEIRVVETDALGRFQSAIFYSCKGDKPDLYFWVEYELGGIPQTVYRPSVACHTYWNYACGTDVLIRVQDNRVPACSNEPDLPGCVVQVLSIGRDVSLSEIQGDGASAAAEGLISDRKPFGGKLEPRVWFSASTLRDVKNIKYYRWSYRRLTTGDGVALATPGPWIQLARTVVRHYAVHVPDTGVTHLAYHLGPRTVGSEANLFEIRPGVVPAGGIEWTIVDEREDLASAHFESHLLGNGANACEMALDAAGKYEIKLELFKDSGALVDWTGDGVGLQITNVAAPFGTNPVTAATASDYHRILNGSGHTVGFRMVLRVDNNCCQADVLPVGGICGFSEYAAGATTMLGFKAQHPNNFADFDFSVMRGGSTAVSVASATKGAVGSLSVATDAGGPPDHAYMLTLSGSYRESFGVDELLETCTSAAFSEALHVYTHSTDGYGRLWTLDAFAHGGFALAPSA